MRCVIPSQYRDRLTSLLCEVGYVYHCKVANQACYHRSLHSAEFPRFHLLVTPGRDVYSIDLHLDQYTVDHKGNHGEPWAYTGVRVHEEIAHILEHLKDGHLCVGSVNQPSLGFVDSATRDRPLTQAAHTHTKWPWQWHATFRM